MADKIFIDTSALYAFFDKSDAEHEHVKEYLSLSDDFFYTSNFIIDELITLLRCRKFNVQQIKPFIDDIRKASFTYVLHVTAEIEDRSLILMNKYKEHDFSFTDCTTFVLMRENFIKKACTLDEHFKIAGFRVFP